jgi:hypothetical protein
MKCLMRDLFWSFIYKELQFRLYFRRIFVLFGLSTDFIYEDFNNLLYRMYASCFYSVFIFVLFYFTLSLLANKRIHY